jgi:hypothetical protein
MMSLSENRLSTICASFPGNRGIPNVVGHDGAGGSGRALWRRIAVLTQLLQNGLLNRLSAGWF